MKKASREKAIKKHYDKLKKPKKIKRLPVEKEAIKKEPVKKQPVRKPVEISPDFYNEIQLG